MVKTTASKSIQLCTIKESVHQICFAIKQHSYYNNKMKYQIHNIIGKINSVDIGKTFVN